MSLTSMNNAYRHRFDNHAETVRARVKAGQAIVRMIENHPRMAERYVRILLADCRKK